MRGGDEALHMRERQEHQREVEDFLHKHLSIVGWRFSLPNGSGRESYFVHGLKRTYFVKVGVDVERYIIMADLGLTPPVILHGQLESGLPIIVQLCVRGHTPSRADYRERLAEVAELVRNMHNNPRSKGLLQSAPSNLYEDAGNRALNHLRQTWERYRTQAPMVAEFVDQSLDYLAGQVDQFSGEGLVASHGDICNANWLFAQDGRIYVLDFESMSLDDPAFDLGALLWWYYPPELREPFLNIAGCPHDDEFKFRMRVRMAMHCLSILLPREESFDEFDAEALGETLTDFRAILEGKENPQGYA